MPVPVMVSPILLIFMWLTCIAAPRVPNADNEVPFSFEKGFIVVKAFIKGNTEVEVIIATGSEYSLADERLLAKYKVPVNSRFGPPVSNIYFPIKAFTSVPDVNVGQTKTSSLVMGIGSTATASKLLGREIFGTLGANFFKNRAVQVDFKKRIVRFLDPSSPEISSATNRTTSIRLRVVEDNDQVLERPTRPVVEGVVLNGTSHKVLFDTGAVTVVALSSNAAKKLGYAAPTDKGSPRSDTVKSLVVGGYEITNVPIVIYGKETNSHQGLEEYGAVVGSVFLQNFIVTFDFHNKLIVLEHR
jgi:phosphotransferase system IIB component